MWGAIVKSAGAAVGVWFVAMIVERMLGVLLDVGGDAPNSGSSAILDWLGVIQNNFLLIGLLGIVVAYLARAQVEARLVN